MNMGTWNVLSLYRPSALQEIRSPGVGHIDVENSVLFYSDNDQKAHAFGTGFALKKSLLNSVLRFEPLGDRMFYSLLSVHASTKDKNEAVKDLFYDTLERKLANFPNKT